ncbi:MAG: site-specific integrase [Bdellovibrionota bacterium]
MSSDIKGIKQINTEGSNQFAVSVKVKSKIDPLITVQRERKKNIKTLEQAIAIRNQLLDEAQHQVVKREFLGAGFGSMVESWEDGVHTGKIFSVRTINRQTLEDYGKALRKYLIDFWPRTAAEITAAEISQRLYKIHMDGMSRSVLLKLKSALNAIYDWAISSGRVRGIQQSPAKNVPLYARKVEKQQPILNIQEIRKLIAASEEYNHEWRAHWLFALHCGVRNGEAYALEWTDVDLENRRLFINKSFNKRSNKTGPTKSGYIREVPINDELARLLMKLRAQHSATSKFVLPRIHAWNKGEQARVLREFCKLIGIPEINFHALRACFATQLLRNGVEPARVMKICGWKELATMQRYIRLSGVDVAGVTDSLKFTSGDEAVAKVVNLFGPK